VKPETQTRELGEEEIARLINEVLQEPEKYEEEARLILKLVLNSRRSGCGYIYLYREDMEVLEGSVDTITLSKSEYNCDVEEEVAIVPKTVPVVLKITYLDTNPEVGDYIQYYVFDGKGWRSVKVILPKE